MCSPLIKYILSLMTICLQRKINLLNDIGRFFLLSSRHISMFLYVKKNIIISCAVEREAQNLAFFR